MAILATIFGVLGRFAGKVLTMSLGWASSLLFGRVPRDRQILLAAITFGAVIWAVLVVAVVWPDGGSFLLTLAPIPPWVEERWIRLAMLAGALILPLGLGAATLGLTGAEDRPKGFRDIALHVLRGYPLAAAWSTMLAFLAAIGIARKVGALIRRWTDTHIPIVVKPGGYEQLAADLDQAISDAGIEIEPRAAPAILVVPARLLGIVAGAHMRGLLPDRLVRLVGKDVEVLIYPSDVAISGRAVTTARVQAALASRLTTAKAWLTASAEGQAIEDRLARLAQRRPSGAERAEELAAIDRELATRDLPYDEWEVLYRQRLQVDRDLLAGDEPGETMPVAGGRSSGPSDPGSRRTVHDSRPRDRVDVAVAAGALVLLAADVALIIARMRSTDRRSV